MTSTAATNDPEINDLSSNFGADSAESQLKTPCGPLRFAWQTLVGYGFTIVAVAVRVAVAAAVAFAV